MAALSRSGRLGAIRRAVATKLNRYPVMALSEGGIVKLGDGHGARGMAAAMAERIPEGRPSFWSRTSGRAASRPARSFSPRASDSRRPTCASRTAARCSPSTSGSAPSGSPGRRARRTRALLGASCPTLLPDSLAEAEQLRKTSPLGARFSVDAPPRRFGARGGDRPPRRARARCRERHAASRERLVENGYARNRGVLTTGPHARNVHRRVNPGG